MVGTRIENSAAANGHKTRNTQRRSLTDANTAEYPRKEAPGVAIPIELIIAVLRTVLRRLRQNRSRERFVFFRVRAYSKMWLRRSSLARLPIRCLFLLACSWKNRDDTKFVSRRKPKGRFINLARTTKSRSTGNSSSVTHSGSLNATVTRSML